MTRRSTASGLVPKHTTWGIVFVAACVSGAAGLLVGFFIGWSV